MRYLIRIMYDGTLFHGWQYQPNQRTVQEELEKAILHISGVKTDVIAAGRTDAGVHATAQSAHFDYNGLITPVKLLLAFRTLLPADIKVWDIQPVRADFHARFDAYERSYLFLLSKEKTPFNRCYMSYIYRKIDMPVILKCVPYLLGEHDYSSFGRPNPEVPNKICNVKQFNITEQQDHYRFEISADRFLHNMVRRIIGALVSVSHHGFSPDKISDWLLERNPRQQYVFTAPPHGLYLTDVKYPDNSFITND